MPLVQRELAGEAQFACSHLAVAEHDFVVVLDVHMDALFVVKDTAALVVYDVDVVLVEVEDYTA